MRAVCFVERLQWDVPGTLLRHGLTIGDVDNDGDNELVAGSAEGDLYIFKGSELWQKKSGLGLISCVVVGDIFNYGRNALVVVTGDGWVYIYYSPRASPGEKADASRTAGMMECVHTQRIPTNTKVALVADVDKDGANELIIGLTDRVVRSYRWSSNADLGTGKLVGLNKWECANQIGTIALQDEADGRPTLLVGQPGGTFMRIKCNADEGRSEDDWAEPGAEASASRVDYQTLGISRMRNPNVSTEVLGNLLDPASDGKSYALATLDGTIMLVRDETILWSMQVDHHISALAALRVTGAPGPEIVACSWDGQTYILDQARNSVRFQFEEPVRAFCAGSYSLRAGVASACLVYNNFGGKLFLYHELRLPSLPLSALEPEEALAPEQRARLRRACARPADLLGLSRFLLYSASAIAIAGANPSG